MSVPGKRALRFERSVRVDTGAAVWDDTGTRQCRRAHHLYFRVHPGSVKLSMRSLELRRLEWMVF